MPIRSILFFASILFGLYLYISVLNPEDLQFQIYPGVNLRASLALLMLLAFLAGGLIVAFTDALRDLKRTLELKGFKRRQKALWEYLEDAEEERSRGDLVAAEEELKRAIKLLPGKPLLYLKLAEVYRAQGKLEEALRAVRAARTKGILLQGLFAEARILLDMGRKEEGERVLIELLKVHPQNAQALRILRDLKMKEGSWGEALEFHERLLKSSPESDGELLVALRYERAKTLGKSDGKEALKELKRLSKAHPLFVPARVLWGDVLLERGRTKAALEVFKKAFRDTKNPVFLQRMEDLYLREGNPRGAVHMYLEVLSDSPDDPIARLLYARLCLRLGMPEETLSRLSEGEHQLSHFPLFFHLKARAHMEREEWQQAVEALQKAMALEGREPVITYRCEACGHLEPEWVDRCPSCLKWGTFNASLSSWGPP